MLENPTSSSVLSNPLPLYENQGLMSGATWAHFGTAAVATALGLVVADFVDRIVATRQPPDSGSAKSSRPWFGRDAAAAQRMRPDAWRLGAQAAGAVISLGLAFWTRNIKFLPWALGGVALGFASNLLMKVTTWWLMPAFLKVQKADEQTLANRTYVLEQDATQTVVTGMFEKWDQNPSLAQQQDPTNPVILGPLASSGASGTYALGKGQPAAPNTVGSPKFVNTGRLGLCPFCKQVNGCLSNCPSLCPSCADYRPFTKARYQVKAGDNLTQLAALGGVNISDVNALNGGTSPETYWQPDKTVIVPYGMAMVLERREGGSVGTPPSVENPAAPAPAPAIPTPVPAPAAPAPEVIAKHKPVNLQNFGLVEENNT